MQSTLSHFQNLISWLPEGALWVLILSALCILAGWIASIAVAVRQKWLALLAFFPVTNPVAVVMLLFKNTSAAMIPLSLYGLGLVIWFSGSAALHRSEFKQLAEVEQRLKDQGETLSVEDLRRSPSHPDRNIWDHPFFKPMAEAGQPAADGEAARKTLDQHYQSLDLYKRNSNTVSYEGIERDRVPLNQPIQTLHTFAVGRALAEKRTTNPANEKETLAFLDTFMNQTHEALAPMKEALEREEDIYPHAWKEGFQMLLPHLAKLKMFSQTIRLCSVYHTMKDDPAASFDDALLTLRLAQVGAPQLLISRLVQIAQLSISLDTLVAAQLYHAWTDEQWRAMDQQLASFDLISAMADSFRSERTMAYTSLEPSLKLPPSQAMRIMAQLGGSDLSSMTPTFAQRIGDLFCTQFSQAFHAKQWRLCLKAYEMMIHDLEQAALQSRTQAWKEIQIDWSHMNLQQFGLFGSTLLPALDKAQEKAIRIQVHLALARTAIAIERYHLRHQHYPPALQDLVPDFLAETPREPMTHETLPYQPV